MLLRLRRKFLLLAEGIHYRGTESTKISLGYLRIRSQAGSGVARLFGLQIRPSSSNCHEQTPNFETCKNADNRSNKPSPPLQILVLSVSPW
jgi:hypothetical protein